MSQVSGIDHARAVVGDGLTADAGGWTFSGDVPFKFDQHVRHSVPLYGEGHDLITSLSEFFLGRNSLCYDIGCSTGTLIADLARKYSDRGATFVGLEVEQAMVDFAQKSLAELTNLEFLCEDACRFEYERSDLIISYYTAQFIPPSNRTALIRRIYDSLNPGGALILFEKTRASNSTFQDIFSQSYNDFKLQNGYTAEEILSKSRSLKRVLDPFTTQQNNLMLREAGFRDISLIMKYLSFEGILAVKD